MKNILLVLVSSTIWSCANRTSDHSILADASTTKDNLIEQTDSAKILTNANFPFGCADLKNFEYPKHWEGDLEHYGHLKKPNGQEFESIGKCFNVINSAKTILSPRPRKVELLEIGNVFRSADNLDTLMQKSIDSCRYRLPDIGIYECYYSYQHYGNLILFDPKTNEGKLLNIYADDLGGDSHTILRYFYMNKNELSIYEAACYDDGCILDEKYKIIIHSDGRININTIDK